ncbi:MAG: hypothetical protein ACREJO_01115 [Phycisphaerales bacterium]
MSRQNTSNVNRLFAAADILLEKLAIGADTPVTIRTTRGNSRLGAPTEFTAEEYVEAMALLMRIGLVEREEYRANPNPPR